MNQLEKLGALDKLSPEQQGQLEKLLEEQKSLGKKEGRRRALGAFRGGITVVFGLGFYAAATYLSALAAWAILVAGLEQHIDPEYLHKLPTDMDLALAVVLVSCLYVLASTATFLVSLTLPEDKND